MTDGIFVNGNRAKSKKEIVLGFKEGKEIEIEETNAICPKGYSGNIKDLPDGNYYFVGPDPYTSRKYYGSIKKKGDAIKIE
jgi:hypothetical protein